MKRYSMFVLAAWLVVAVLFQSCEDEINCPTDSNQGPVNQASAITVTPSAVTLNCGDRQTFTAALSEGSGGQFQWSIVSGPGEIASTGEYTAPAQLAVHSMSAVIKVVVSGDTTKVGYATVTVLGSGGGTTGGNDTTGTGGGGGGQKDTTVCFERDILPILRSNCAMSGCHDSFTREEGIDFTSYESMMNSKEDDLVVAHRPFDSELYEVLVEDKPEKRMPPSPRAPLTSEQIGLIRRWIAEGAKNRDCSNDTTSTGCDLTNVTFSKTIQPILQNNCVGCHSGSAPSAGVSLVGYASVKAVADDGSLVGVTAHSPGFKTMPPGGKLQNCEIEQIRTWVQSGAPNN